MPIYPMQCKEPTFAELRENKGSASLYGRWCGHKWDLYTSVALYERSQEVEFRDILCPACGNYGTRYYPADSAPAVDNVQGTWDRSAPPALRGKTFVNRAERDEQVKNLGDAQQSTNEDKRWTKPPERQEPKRDLHIHPDHEPEPSAEVTETVEQKIVAYLSKAGPTRAGVIIDTLDLKARYAHAVMSKSKSIKRVKRGVYGIRK